MMKQQNQQEILSLIKNQLKTYCDTYFDSSFQEDNPIVRLHEPTFSEEEIFAALETLLSTYTTMGKKVRAFETQYANYTESRYSIMSNSGSSANLLTIAALTNPVTQDHLNPDDEVIVPALSWSTTVWPLIQHQLVPVFVDCDLNDFNLDLNQLEKAISPKTRAIHLVHVYGNPCNMDAIMDFAKKHRLIVIEDCCEAMGASYKNKPVGSFGLVGNFSFFFSHHVNTMEGGISVTDDFNLSETLRILRAHGWSREACEHQKYINMYPEIDPRFIFINLGYNLRPTELHAAIGKLQLPKLNTFNDIRREVAHFYLKHLAKYDEFFHFQQETPQSKHVWFGFPIILKEKTPFSLKEITSYLQTHGIETRPIIAGNLARHPAFKYYRHRIVSELSNADTIMNRGFAFACHHAVDEKARRYVIDTIDTFVEEFLQNRIHITQTA